ncbi:sulfatase-like hydrolase/transferase [Lacrimispora sp.]|uniref:sulfatase-like hydrolase/transferase n=1 Tax=Lacrimispora sp. TaxID=2719234 RepID=UPI00289AF8A7|nr:sulfatase-like hydrolase/transferase [Lacrimispora sp.]
MKKRPHIIIFNPDEMRWDTMGHMGNPAAATPFLDAFAGNEAVSFRNAFCQNPVCVPSRCSFFTGLYPHVHGHRTMSHLLHPGEDNLFSELRAAGYYVWMNARNDLFAGQIEGWAESNADEIFYGGNVPQAPGPFVPPAAHQKGDKDLYSHFEGKLALDADGRNYNSDDESVDAAIEFIKNRKTEQPLCMFLGLMFPHVPYEVEDPYYSAIDQAKLPLRVKAEECSGKSRMLDLIRKYQQLDSYSEEDWNELRAIYLGMCAKIDAQFQRLCDGLKAAGIYDDCAIFFLSDHGDFDGDYGLTEKAQNSFEDCLVRVPLLVKPPKDARLDAGVTDALAELVDFYATAMDYAGEELKRTQFGRSLRPVIEDRSRENRSFVYCEGGRLPEEEHCDEFHSSGPNGPDPNFVYWPKMMAQTDDIAHAKGTMIRNRDYKYVSRIAGADEFYDLKADPMERVNRINDPACKAVIIHMQEEMLKWYQRTCDLVPYAYDRRFTDEMLWAKVKNICPPGSEAEIKEKIREGMKQGLLMQYIKNNYNCED